MQFLKYQRLTILWSVFIFVLCCMPMGNSESHMFFPGFDKLVHCGFFFVFVVLTSNGYIRQKGFSAVTIFLISFVAFLFGGLIEILQHYIFTWRDGNLEDLFADTVGIGMATFSILVINSAVKYVKS